MNPELLALNPEWASPVAAREAQCKLLNLFMSRFSHLKIGEGNIVVRIKRGNRYKALAIINTKELVFNKLLGWPKKFVWLFSCKMALVALGYL